MTIFEQIGNIGSEITRARVWEEKGDSASRDRALERALVLINLAIGSQSNSARLSELTRLRELVSSMIIGSSDYLLSLRQLEEYCLPFALAARAQA